MKLGIYIHIPYCIKKCNYCDFVSYPLSTATQCREDYFSWLKNQIDEAGKLYGQKYTVDSVFFGGGTPTCVEPEYITDALQQLKEAFAVAEDAEISLEANPGTLTEEKLKAYRKAGFNRISLGIQSLNDNVLQIMGRIHNSRQAMDSYYLARKYFDNINLDLIIGTPGQTPDIWREGLRKVLEWNPEHISFYSLQLEEGTPFYEDYRSGKIELPSWEENREMYHESLRMLKNAGYHHYEISNGAKPGKECRHNIKYWEMKPFLGIGTAAYSFMEGVRFAEKLAPDPEDYQSREENSLRGDFVFTQLRLIDGLDTELYRRMFHRSFEEDYGVALNQLISDGMLKKNGQKIAFTEKGLDFTNPVMERLLNI